MVFTRRNLDWWCERGILMLVLVALVFAPLAFGAVYPWTFLVVQALVIGVAVLWAVRLWGGHKPKLLWPPLAWAVTAFVLYAVARYFTADIEYVARLELIRVLLYAFLFLAVVSNLYSQDAAVTISYTLTAVAALASSYAVVQFLHHSNQVWNLTAPVSRPRVGNLHQPRSFRGFSGTGAAVAAGVFAGGPGRRRHARRAGLRGADHHGRAGGDVFARRLGGGGGGNFHAARLFTVPPESSCPRAAGAVGAAGGRRILSSHYLSKTVGYMRRVAKPDDNGPAVMDTSARLQMWGPAAQMWRDHFWCGVGPGHYDYRFREYRPEGFQQRPEHAHNDYLELLADWGTAGGVIVFGRHRHFHFRPGEDLAACPARGK